MLPKLQYSVIWFLPASIDHWLVGSKFLLGIIQPGEKGSTSAIQLRKSLLRYCLLSWTLLMSTISPIMKKKYADSAEPNELLAKRLITQNEIQKLMRNETGSMAWWDKWWLPMNWCMLLINKELHEKGHLPRY